MAIKKLIAALYKSKLHIDSDIMSLLWKADGKIPSVVFDYLLDLLEESDEDYPELLHLLLSECTPYFTVN